MERVDKVTARLKERIFTDQICNTVPGQFRSNLRLHHSKDSADSLVFQR